MTATAVAMNRAIATRANIAGISDPYAEPLVSAVGIGAYARYARGEIDGAAADDIARMADGIAARTRFYDDFVADAVDSGIRQVVILASGLDARAYRLRWPSDVVVYELDQPQVIEFKTRTLADLGATPAAEHRTIGVDLRDDWPAALRAAGFDSSEPAAWLAEGLLVYLPPEAQDRLLDNITELSAPGSRIATENTATISSDDLVMISERMQEMRGRWLDKGIDLGVDVDIAELFYPGERSESATYLAGSGWRPVLRASSELFAEYGMPASTEVLSAFGDITYLSATLGER
ncbi:SAM-dependent methyltransferase [Arthrobacter sp. SLBN-53]|uniref:SAM-dependent methyltransferase n=1 Tax=Arthrobacter sp. SLBN-53 TaxID=2768412 RepID=UPI00114E67B0|nr:SAM-dependent methyltransferase [Arthrobacter sp. SLBN-53]